MAVSTDHMFYNIFIGDEFLKTYIYLLVNGLYIYNVVS